MVAALGGNTARKACGGVINLGLRTSGVYLGVWFSRMTNKQNMNSWGDAYDRNGREEYL